MNLKIRGTTLWINGKKYCDHIDGGDGIYSNEGMEIPDKQPSLCPMCLNMQGSGNLEKLLPEKEPTAPPNMASIYDVNVIVIRLLESLASRFEKRMATDYAMYQIVTELRAEAHSIAYLASCGKCADICKNGIPK